MRLGKSFLWGAATSSHQVEGGNIHNDWWAWEQKGFIEGKVTSALACDHWNRFREDLRYAAEMGLTSYRFSVEWSRIEPREGEWDPTALDWYEELLAECERWGLLPMLTLHHFTIPEWLAQRGGFSWRETPKFFARYVRKVVERLGPRVPLWCTLNEPIGMVAGQYLGGFMPPAKMDPVMASRACRTLLASHVAAYDIIHSEIKERKGPWRQQPIAVGTAHNMIDFLPAREWHPIDRLASQVFHRMYNRAWLDAISGRRQHFGVTGFIPYAPQVNEALGRYTCDYMGVNYYLKAYLRWRPKGDHYETQKDLPLGVAFAEPGEKTSEMGWALHPSGLGRVIRIAGEYGLPILITENGIADGSDELRAEYLRTHLLEIAKAIQQGYDIRGYYYWSLIDNFEWIKGFAPRFGLIEVNYDTMERRRRESAEMYRKVITAHHEGGRYPNAELIQRVFGAG